MHRQSSHVGTVKGYRVPKSQGYTSKFSKLEYLVGGLEPWNFMTFHSVGNFIIPTDELRFQRGRYTTNQ